MIKTRLERIVKDEAFTTRLCVAAQDDRIARLYMWMEKGGNGEVDSEEEKQDQDDEVEGEDKQQDEDDDKDDGEEEEETLVQ